MKNRKNLNPRIMGIVGSMGAGKTLFLSTLCSLYKDSHTIIANYDITYRDMDLYPESVGEMFTQADNYRGKKLLAIDEVHVFFDSRMSHSKANMLFSYFVTQTRKQDIQLFYTTQQFRQVDIRLRDNTDVLAFPIYDEKKDALIVHFYDRHFMTGEFNFAMTKRYRNVSQIFNHYTTEQLIGHRMIEKILEEEEKEK